MKAQQIIKQLHGVEIDFETIDFDCDLTWGQVINLMEAHSVLQIQQYKDSLDRGDQTTN